MRPLPALAAAVVVAALAAGGCGAADDKTPVVCLEGVPTYLSALTHAPAVVKLRGELPISGCLIENQEAGDLASVGATLVSAATRLNDEARAEPGGQANLELGYLLGAAQRGADESEGIHTELIRRLAVAARYSPDNRPLPAQFTKTYREGFDLGHAEG